MKKPSKKRGRFLDLKRDLIFKEYFKSNLQTLVYLLRAFIPPPAGPQIKSVRIKDSSLQAPEHSKHPVLDLHVSLNTGQIVNVEMQVVPEKHFDKRVLFYLTKIYSQDLEKGQDYGLLRPVYSLVFVDFNIFPKEKGFYYTFSLRRDKAPFFMFSPDLRVIFVDLSQFFKQNLNNLFDVKDLWCYFVKKSGEISEEDLEILSTKGEGMKTAANHLIKLSRSGSLQMLEEAQDKWDRIRKAREAYQFDEGKKKGRVEGRKEGRKEGLATGLKKGIATGLKKGIATGLKKGRVEGMQEVALSMLKRKVDISLISEVTGLSEKEIKNLQNGS